MECDNYAKNGHNNSERFVESCGVGVEFGASGSRALRLGFAAGVPGTVAIGAPHLALGPRQSYYNFQSIPHTDHPFMSTMDEISYWIYTKRAPCLMNYDNEIKKQNEEAQTSKIKPKSVPSAAEVPSPRKKKKRKLSLLDDNSSSTGKQNPVYFECSQNKKQTVVGSGKSDSLDSDIDFNIKTSSIQIKKNKRQKNSRTTLHKKNKMVTSTPKVTQLRRSLRQAQQCSTINNSQLNSSFEIFNTSVINGHHKNAPVEPTTVDKKKKPTEVLGDGDHNTNNNKKNTVSGVNKPGHEVINGQFEDLSDVSGFTANYIRSTKLQLTKAPRKLRCKNSRNLTKESQLTAEKHNTMVVCVNKSVSTAHKSAVQNCSTDSENVINLVTARSNEKPAKVSKSTSLLKFMESKTAPANIKAGARSKKAALDVSFQSKSSTSRYPKRNKNCLQTEKISSDLQKNAEKKKKINQNSNEFNNSDKKENTESLAASKTRSGRNIGLTLRQSENSVLVLSNSTEQVSSMVSMNVASPVLEQKERKKKRITRHLRAMKVPHGVQRDLIREKSGFSACFSDSDGDAEPLKQPKFFCAKS